MDADEDISWHEEEAGALACSGLLKPQGMVKDVAFDEGGDEIVADL